MKKPARPVYGWKPDVPDQRDIRMKGYFTMPYDYLPSRDLSDDFWTISSGELIKGDAIENLAKSPIPAPFRRINQAGIQGFYIGGHLCAPS